MKFTNNQVSLYADNCATCHGLVNGLMLIASPALHGRGHAWHHPDRLLHQWILDKPLLVNAMPALMGTLSDEQVMQEMA